MQKYGQKTPWELRCYTMDFTRNLANGEFLTGIPTAEVTVLFGSDPNKDNILFPVPCVIDSTGTIAGVWLTGGIPGVTYKIVLKCVSNLTEKLEGQVSLEVVTNL